jgi:rod shape-determining protein MreD
LLLERLLYLWVLSATGQLTPTLYYWVPTFIGALLWPWVYAVLRDLGRRAGVL